MSIANGLLKKNEKQQEELLGDGKLKQVINNPFFGEDLSRKFFIVGKYRAKPEETAV